MKLEKGIQQPHKYRRASYEKASHKQGKNQETAKHILSKIKKKL